MSFKRCVVEGCLKVSISDGKCATHSRQFDPVADVEAFHSKFGLKYEGGPRLLPEEIANFRTKFMQEELDEYVAAADFESQAKMLDALVDLTYVVLGNAYLHGYDFREAWRRVHAANMAKVRAASADQSKRKNVHDVVKPPGWVAPDLSDLVAPNPDWRKELLEWIRVVHAVVADGCKTSCAVSCVNPIAGGWACTFGGYCFGNLSRHEVVEAGGPEELTVAVKKKITDAIQSELDDDKEDCDPAYVATLERALRVARGGS